VENREFTLQVFLDIERAFDSTLFDIITKAAKRYGLAEGPICTTQVHWDHKGLNPVANQSINQSMGLETQFFGRLAVCWVAGKLWPHLQEKLWRGL